jgi:hypothetical protein
MSGGWDGGTEISVLIGGGSGVTILLLALVERLRRTFATRQEMEQVEARFRAIEALYAGVREAADDARERADAAEREQRRQWERVSEQVIRPLERSLERLESVCEAQAVQATTLDHLVKRMDQADAGWLRGRRSP